MRIVITGHKGQLGMALREVLAGEELLGLDLEAMSVGLPVVAPRVGSIEQAVIDGQTGVLAAAGIVSLNEMVERLAEDHANAKQLAVGLAQIPGLIVDPDQINTNIKILFKYRAPIFIKDI